MKRPTSETGKCLVITSLWLLAFIAQAQTKDSVANIQTDVIDYAARLINRQKKSEELREKRNTWFSIIPIAPGSTGGDKVAVSAINASFYLSDPKDTYVSSMYFYPYTNFGSRGGLIISANLWADHNRWNMPVDLRWLRIQTKAYRQGGGTPNNDYHLLDYNHFRSYVTIHRLVIEKFYIGVGYNLDVYHDIKSESDPNIDNDPESVSSGITMNLLRDSRKNSGNPKNGFYTTLIFRLNNKKLGSSEDWNSVYFDARKYFPIATRQPSLFALRSMYWGTFGNTPYLDLPGSFLDLSGRAGRGYFMGRYRGEQMLYLEGEYRLQLSSNGFWGLVFFSNFQSYSEPDSGNFEYLIPAVGTGLRIKFNKRSDINVTLDFAVGKDSFNWYLSIGEWF